MATSVTLCFSNLTHTSAKHWQKLVRWRSDLHFQVTNLSEKRRCHQRVVPFHRFRVSAATEASTKSNQSDEKSPSWARPDSDEPPPWAREELKPNSAQAFEVPYYAYLLASAIIAIAAIDLFSSTSTRSLSLAFSILIAFFMLLCLDSLPLPAYLLQGFFGSNLLKLQTKQQRSKTEEMETSSYRDRGIFVD